MLHKITVLAFLILFWSGSGIAQNNDANQSQVSQSTASQYTIVSENTPTPPNQLTNNLTTGVIRGKVVDKNTSEELIEAYITISGLNIGTRSDLDGTYMLKDIPTGIYNINVDYISYSRLVVSNVKVEAGKTIVLDLAMQEENTATTETVVIEAKALQNNESALLNLQKVSSVSLDGISFAQTQKNGDNTAAASLMRVTGLSVEGGRYIYVRGLGDRYNKTLVNGAEVPGLDPTRNAVQLDMYPSNLVDNIIVYKSFAPDLPGSFTGGLIDIATRDFPEKFTLSASMQFGFNDQSTFNKDYILYNRGGLDWFGIDDGSRAEPFDVRGKDKKLPVVNQKYDNSAAARLTDKVTKEFGGDMYPTSQNNFLDHAFSFSAGNQTTFLERPLGIIASVSLRRQYNFYNNGTEALWRSLGQSGTELTDLYSYKDTRGQENSLFGSLLTLSYKISNNHKISLTYMHNHAGDASARYQTGEAPLDGPGQIRENRVLQYLERSVNIGQLRGEHLISKLWNTRIQWTSSFVYLNQEEPDLRFFTNHYEIDDFGKTNYFIATSQYDPPTRYYRFLDEMNSDTKVHITFPLNNESKIKAGGAYTTKLRAPFREKWYQYAGDMINNYNGKPADFFAERNLGTDAEGKNWRNYLQDISIPSNSYDGKEAIGAAYIMGDFSISHLFRIVTGARLESTNITVESKDPAIPLAQIKTNDILPCLNFIYRPSVKTNIRLSYGRTVARPIMREMAAYSNFEFIGGYLVIGNSNLKRTLIDNLDFRLEYFPSNNEVISFSAFYKNFNAPIERAINPKSGGSSTEINYRNVDHATSYGLEFEVKKRILKQFSIGVNASLIQSQVQIAPDELALIRAYIPNTPDSRQMFAQSPYLINGNLGYQNDSLGLSITANYNVFGPRIMEVGAGGSPNVYEQARHTVDINLQKQFGRFALRINLQNLLNPKFRFTQTFNDREYTFREFTTGRRITIGISYQIK